MCCVIYLVRARRRTTSGYIYETVSISNFPNSRETYKTEKKEGCKPEEEEENRIEKYRNRI